MKRRILCFIALASLLAGCTGGNKATQTTQTICEATKIVLTDATKWNEVYHKIEAKDIEDNAISLINDQWMLITSGNAESFNTMTASWGALGELWAYDVSMITVRNTRYTGEFLQKNDTYTLSFFDEEYRPKLQLLGSKSGRDSDKIKESGLTPVATPIGSMGFGEARLVMECRKLYAGPLTQEYMIAEIAAKYANQPEGHHILYIGEIVNVWIK